VNVTQDNELIQRILSGEHTAFDELVLRHRRHVYETAYRMVRNRETAEEIVQETFIRVFKSLHTFRQKAKFTTWLYRITMNLCMNELNHSYRPVDEAPREPADDSPSVTEKMAEEERKHWLEREIQSLPFKQKWILVLRIYRGMPFNEIARIVGCSAGSAKVNYRHAVVRLKANFSHSGEEL
jgi:RNA polymerase sigma-70 factor (ECF subfamily)